MFNPSTHPFILKHQDSHTAHAGAQIPTPESSWPVTPTAELPLYHPRDPPPVSLFLLLDHFPGVPHMLSHPQFPTLVQLWTRFQLNTTLAKTPMYRPYIHEDLGHISIQCDGIIQHLLGSSRGHLAYPDPPGEKDDEDPEANSNVMMIAFGRLKDRIEMLQLALQVVENGRVWFGQEPNEALMPILESHMAALQQQQQQQQQLYQQQQDNLSCMACTYVRPSAVVVRHELEQQQQHQQALWPTTAAPAASSASDGHPDKQEQDKMDYIGDGDEDEGEEEDMQETDDSQSPTESTADDDTDFELMDEDDTNDEDDDEYTEAAFRPKRNTRSSRRNGNKQQQQQGRAKQQGQEDEDETDDLLIEATDASLNVARRLIRVPRQHSRRTATSYDAETTHYLKSVFFSIYSKRDKLTKEQRRQVQLHTGLKPRNITYWFSNHKRRFQTALKVYKMTVQRSGGEVKTYDDFLTWRRRRGLSDDVLDEEEADENTASPTSAQAAASPVEDENTTPSSPCSSY